MEQDSARDNDGTHNSPMWNSPTKEVCDESTGILEELDDMLRELDENPKVSPSVTSPNDDLRHYLNNRRGLNSDGKTSTTSEASMSCLDPSKHSLISFESLAGNISHPSKILNISKHRPITFDTSAENNSEDIKCFPVPKRKTVSFNLPAVECSSEAFPLKHKPITFSSSNENIPHASKIPKPKPILLNNYFESLSEPKPTISPLKRKPITFSSSNDNVSETLTPPKRRHRTFKSCYENNHLERTKNPSVGKYKPIRFNSSTENVSSASKKLNSPKHKPISYNSSVESISEGIGNLLKAPVNSQSGPETNPQKRNQPKLVNSSKLVIFEDTKDNKPQVCLAKDTEINEICQAFHKSTTITPNTLMKRACSSSSIFGKSKERRRAVVSLRKWSPSENLAPIDEMRGMKESATYDVLSQVESPTCDVKPLLVQCNLNMCPGGSTTKVQGAVSCSECRKCINSDSVFWCKCRVICQSCKNNGNICNMCEMMNEADTRLVNIHLAAPHPCHYEDCTQAIRLQASYKRPLTRCFLCKEPLPSLYAILKHHFEEFHSNHNLIGRNVNVEVAGSLRDKSGGEQVDMFGFTSGMFILITLNKNADEGELILNSLNFSAPLRSFWVKFEFIADDSSDIFSLFAVNNRLARLSTSSVKLPCDLVKDWTTGKRKLSIRVLSKRLVKSVPDCDKPAKKKRREM